ncbi:MAG: hypothetical protein QHJ81_08670 [Anaerolineae bacterium]|nr:hypothetical protein [Anaerolineae bacterium]
MDEDGGEFFFRLKFACPACGYWLYTRRENFNVLGPAREESPGQPALPPEADQRIRLDLTHMSVRQFMPRGVESYECGRVWTSARDTVSKTWSDFSVGGLHLCLAILGHGYLKRGEQDLGVRAFELAVDALRTADKDDPALSEDNPANRRKAASVLLELAQLYEQQGRLSEAESLAEEAYGWAPEFFVRAPDEDNS